jgi:Secretion system C-terminal sorting domain
MKKSLLLGAFLATASSVFAQTTLYSADFNTGSIPANIKLIDEDSLPHHPSTVYIDKAWRAVGGTRFAAETDSFAVSTSYNEPNGVPLGAASDWLITPAITLGSNAVFKWTARSFDPSYPDAYEVRIGTAPTLAAMNAGSVLYSTTGENFAWTARQVGLSVYAGQTVYIAIRNTTNEGYLLGIDDLKVEGNVPVSTSDAHSFCQLKASPNPTTGSFDLKIATETPQNIQIKLLNTQGQTIATQVHQNLLNETITFDELNTQAAGVYFVQVIIDNESVQTIKISLIK